MVVTVPAGVGQQLMPLAELLRPLAWLEERQIHSIGDEVQIFLPEQGFCGIAGVTSLIPFRFNSPESEKIYPDGLQLSPITGTFTHTSENVWELIFDNADTILVTAAHPFYSLDAQDWRLAGELRLGERVQSKDNQGILTGASYLPGKYKVYNLEVRTNHNFLVGSSGLLVHNQCKVSELRELVQPLKKDPDWVLPLSPGSNVLDKNPDWLTELAKLPDQLPVTNTGPSLQRFIDEVGDIGGTIEGELFKAWIALLKTSLNSNKYWLKRISRWQDAGLNFTFTQQGAKIKVFKGGKEVVEINDVLEYFKVKHNGFGGDIFCPLDKTVTVIGLYHPYQQLLGTWYLIDDLKLFKTGVNPGGLNLLNAPNWSWDLNRDWLYEAAIVRGDIIRIISDPDIPSTIWDNGIQPGLPGHNGIKTVTGLEIDFLKSYGYNI
ncbi:MAG: hypothetical protein H6562_06270 [Lewinellaceae bacterium]|nr:hypothetical protein [Lewinellaceae bacterium]